MSKMSEIAIDRANDLVEIARLSNELNTACKGFVAKYQKLEIHSNQGISKKIKILSSIYCFFLGHTISNGICSRCQSSFGVPRMQDKPSPPTRKKD